MSPVPRGLPTWQPPEAAEVSSRAEGTHLPHILAGSHTEWLTWIRSSSQCITSVNISLDFFFDETIFITKKYIGILNMFVHFTLINFLYPTAHYCWCVQLEWPESNMFLKQSCDGHSCPMTDTDQRVESLKNIRDIKDVALTFRCPPSPEEHTSLLSSLGSHSEWLRWIRSSSQWWGMFPAEGMVSFKIKYCKTWCITSVNISGDFSIWWNNLYH